MGKKKEFGEGIVYKICNYIWWFLLGNFYFLITNFLFIIVWLGTDTQAAHGFNLITALSLLPTGPAFTALLAVMGKLIRERDVDITKDFFKAYKKNFFEALFYWSMLLIILSILYIDIIYLVPNLQIGAFKILLVIIAFIIISIAFYIFPIISRFYLRIKDVLKVSFYYSIKKMHITILNFAYLVGLSYIAIKTSSAIVFLFFWSVLSYLIMFNLKGILVEIEEKYIIAKNEN